MKNWLVEGGTVHRFLWSPPATSGQILRQQDHFPLQGHPLGPPDFFLNISHQGLDLGRGGLPGVEDKVGMFPGDQGVPEAVALEPGGLDEPARGGAAGGVFEDAAAASGVGGLPGFASGD